jgi:hypothetical protein
MLLLALTLLVAAQIATVLTMDISAPAALATTLTLLLCAIVAYLVVRRLLDNR